MSSSTLTGHDSSPRDEQDRNRVFQLVVNSLKGVNGNGSWDGGIDGDGWWIKRGFIWEASLVVTLTGDVTLVLPFEANNTVVEIVYDERGRTTEIVQTIDSGKNLNITGLTGKTYIYVKPTRNKRG